MTMRTPSLEESGHGILRVALCQIATREWAIEENLARTLAALDEAAREGAELAITPECVLNGYADHYQVSRERYLASAVALDGPELSAIRARCTALHLSAVVGLAERSGDLIHNSAVAIAADGGILTVYRKVHCRPFEDATRGGHFTPGDRFASFGAGDHTVGLMICFDREIPESVRCLRALGSQLVACPLATNTSDLAAPLQRADNEMITRARAAENELFIAVVNHAERYNGGSFIVGPSGECVVQLDARPQVAVVPLPVGIIARRFHSDPLGWMGWGYRRPDVYTRHLPSKD